MQFRVLGPIEAEARARRLDLGSTKQRALLTLLLLHANQPVSADTLVEDLWGAAAPPRAAATLHAYVSRLRRGLEPARPAGARGGVLVTQPEGYALRVGPDELDAWRFEQLVAAGRAALAAGQVADAADLLRQGLALWRGPAFGEFGTAHFAMAEAARLEELRLTAAEDHHDAGLRLGQHDALVGELERAVMADPLRERPAGQLMVALYRSGRQGEALAVYQSTRRALVDQLGVEPGPELRELEAAILRQDPELSGTSTVAPPVATSPGRSAPQAAPDAWLRPPLPPVITAGSRVPFVGRAPELARLQRAWRECTSSGTRLVLVTGEPGIGKSRLVGHVAGLAYQESATVLWGRATEEAVIGYQAFADALEPLAAAMLGQPAHDLGPAAARLGRLLPTVAARLPSPAFVAKPDVERYLLFEGVRWLLGAAASAGPVVLVLEDLHWADRSSLALLSHLLRRPVAAPLLVLVTYREMELDDDHALRHVVAELAGEPWSDQVELVGLPPDVVAELIGAWGGRAPTESFCRAIAAPTDGNPFYVVEILRHLDESGRSWETVSTGPGEALSLPPTVRTVIDHRLGRLSNGAQQALRAAAVVGRDFDVRVLSFVLGSNEEQLTTALEEAVRARLIVELPSSPGRCTFAHALVRETTYQGLAAPRRALLHRRAGEALEALGAGASDERAAELANHFVRADDLEKAVAYGLRAAAYASARVAYEEAARWYDEVLAALRRLPHPEPRLEAETLLGLGDARVRIGQRERSRDALAAATTAARQAGDAELLARVALGVSDWGVRDLWADYGVVARDTVALLEEALAAGLLDPGLRACLTARLAEELYFDADETRRLELSARAVEAARRLDDPAVLAVSLHSRLRAIWGPDNIAERLAVSTEMLDAATAAGDAELAMTARGRRAANLLELGAHEEADREIAVHRQLAEEMHHPLQQVWSAGLRGGRHLVAGHFDDAEALMTEAAALSPETFASVQAFAGQLCILRIWQGRAAEMVDVAASFVDEFPHVPAWRAGLAVLYAEAGQTDQAATELDRLARGLDDVRRDQNWLFCMGALAEACGRVGNASLARDVYDLLRPHADRFVVLGDGYAVWCSVEQSLGILARTTGRAEAIWHLARALRAERAVGARPVMARTEFEYGLALLGGSESAEEARAHLLVALESARELGMTALAERSERLLADASVSGVA